MMLVLVDDINVKTRYGTVNFVVVDWIDILETQTFTVEKTPLDVKGSHAAFLLQTYDIVKFLIAEKCWFAVDTA
ncbi:hypothetical protein NDU88_000684 [Pleurodeles waltl]|uniref:Uncharacterized protein n=1 Tax=Pleurodeles waltl TaxID=8319 RepID=A0AAV7S6D0_PLEWA|nr:hypothetical protein NDU88_000684 [Pleurodeles waltl]